MPDAIPQAALDALIDEARAANSSALVVLQHGQPIIHEILDGGGERPIETMSVTKAVLSLIVGRAVTLGHLTPDLPISDLFPEWRQGRKRQVTLRHLLTHTSGLQNVPDTRPEISPSPDCVRLALCAELGSEPGTHFAYNNKAANLICGVLERATGRKADDFARQELFGPLGIQDFGWVRDPAGTPHGISGLRLRPADLARLGELARTGGDDLISAEWLRESTHPATTAFPRMGLLWWMWHAWVQFEITPDHVQAARDAGVEARHVDILEALIGTHDRRDLLPRLQERGFAPFGLPPGLTWRTEHPGPRLGFQHDGYLGQYLCVHEAAGLVAVRLIAWDHPQANAPESGFPAFPQRVAALAEGP